MKMANTLALGILCLITACTVEVEPVPEPPHPPSSTHPIPPEGTPFGTLLLSTKTDQGDTVTTTVLLIRTDNDDTVSQTRTFGGVGSVSVPEATDYICKAIEPGYTSSEVPLTITDPTSNCNHTLIPIP